MQEDKDNWRSNNRYQYILTYWQWLKTKEIATTDLKNQKEIANWPTQSKKIYFRFDGKLNLKGRDRRLKNQNESLHKIVRFPNLLPKAT